MPDLDVYEFGLLFDVVANLATQLWIMARLIDRDRHCNGIRLGDTRLEIAAVAFRSDYPFDSIACRHVLVPPEALVHVRGCAPRWQ
jgi:hypothetical protein